MGEGILKVNAPVKALKTRAITSRVAKRSGAREVEPNRYLERALAAQRKISAVIALALWNDIILWDTRYFGEVFKRGCQ